jgi:hypothetical protein
MAHLLCDIFGKASIPFAETPEMCESVNGVAPWSRARVAAS